MYSSEIVIGIDFGTTHSGVSWAINGGSKQVRLITDWPNPRSRISNSEKVPSWISYKDGRPQKYGYNVGLADDSFKWIKILLEPSHKFAKAAKPVENSNELLKTLDKMAAEVVTDYLRYIWEYTLEDIRRHTTKDFRDIYELKVVLTVPAVWSQAAKEKTLEAARAAGMAFNIELVTEPEAAALAVLKDKAEYKDLKVGDCFVVCDAGGGTVDLISYKIEGLNPLRVRETAVGDGGLCGSVFLDLGFEKYVSMLVGEEAYDKLKPLWKKKMIEEFETGIKRSFGNGDEVYSVDLKGIEDDPKNNIIDGTIQIKQNVLRAIFDHVYLQIQDLVEKQVSEVQDRGNVVKAILLVGGFGESKYLFDRLEAANKPGGIPVLQAVGAWSAICRGATLWGLEHSAQKADISKPMTVTSRIARYSYGVAIVEAYDQYRHDEEEKEWDIIEGGLIASGQMRWLLKRGEEVETGRILPLDVYTVVQVGFWDTGSRQFESELYYCEDEKPPRREDAESVKPLCILRVNIPCTDLYMESSFKSVAVKGKFRRAAYRIEVLLGNAHLQFRMRYRDKEVGSVAAEYKENS